MGLVDEEPGESESVEPDTDEPSTVNVAEEEPPPEDAQGKLDLAVEHMEDGRHKVARALLEKAIADHADDPLRPELRYRLAESWFNQESWDRALTAFQTVVDTFGDTDWASRAMLRQGECFAAKGQKENAKLFYEEVLRLYPKSDAATEARRLLAEAGWTDTNGDGFVDKNGENLSFTLTTNVGNPRRAKASVFIQDYLKQAGVEVNIETLAANTFFENLRKKDYEAALSGWSAGLFVDPSTIWHSDVVRGIDPQTVGSDTPNCSDEVTENCVEKRYEFNFVSYSNPEVDTLIEKGLRTPIPEESAPIWKEMQAKIYADQPYTFLWWMDEVIAVNSRFENTSIDVLSPFGRLHEWSVPADKVKYKR